MVALSAGLLFVENRCHFIATFKFTTGLQLHGLSSLQACIGCLYLYCSKGSSITDPWEFGSICNFCTLPTSQQCINHSCICNWPAIPHKLTLPKQTGLWRPVVICCYLFSNIGTFGKYLTGNCLEFSLN